MSDVVSTIILAARARHHSALAETIDDPAKDQDSP
jgi:hypothetical protein